MNETLTSFAVTSGEAWQTDARILADAVDAGARETARRGRAVVQDRINSCIRNANSAFRNAEQHARHTVTEQFLPLTVPMRTRYSDVELNSDSFLISIHDKQKQVIYFVDG